MNSHDAQFIPEFILVDEGLEQSCSANLTFNITILATLYKSVELDDENLLNASRSLPFLDILQQLDAFEWNLDVCTSTYNNILEEMILAKARYTPADLPPPPNFHVEKEVEDLQNAMNWLMNDVLEAYVLQNKTKFDISTALNSETISRIEGYAIALVNDIHDLYIDKIYGDLDNLQVQYREIYTNIVSLFVQLQKYFPERYFADFIRNMDMWLQPMSRLDDINLVEFRLNSSTRWRSWPSYMNMATFADKMANNVLDQIDYSFFGVLKGELQDLDADIVRRLLAIQSHLSQTFQYFSEYVAITDVNEQHILWVF